MSFCRVQSSGAVELYFYGELDPAERVWVQEHFAGCPECREALEELSVIGAALASRPVVAAPPGGEWTGFMARLAVAVQREAQRRPATSVVPFRVAPARRISVQYLAIAALLTLVTASVAYVARSPGGGSIQPQVGQSIPAGGDSMPGAPVHRPRWTPEAAFASMSEQHFERSKLVVLGLASKDPHEATGNDWAYERQLASSLLSDTRLYRLAAEDQGLQPLARVMGDLELVLLQTSLSETQDAATLEQIQRLIRKRDLVTKMQIVPTAAGI